jgi:GNAT superfamily N-acetyltransferase
MCQEIRIRRALLDDLDGIRNAYLASWRAGYAGILAADELEAQALIRAHYDWRSRIDHPNRVVLVAESQGTLVGVLEIEPDPQDVDRLPWIAMLYVVPAVWGCGVAHALTEAAVDLVRAAGREAVWLSVLDVHARARHFYEKEGWQLAEPIGPLTKGQFQRLYLRRDVRG